MPWVDVCEATPAAVLQVEKELASSAQARLAPRNASQSEPPCSALPCFAQVKKELLAQLTATAKEGKLKASWRAGQASWERQAGPLRSTCGCGACRRPTRCLKAAPLCASAPCSHSIASWLPRAVLQGFEQVRAIYLESPSNQFSVENELLTPTFKLKRAPLQASAGACCCGAAVAAGVLLWCGEGREAAPSPPSRAGKRGKWKATN